MNQLKIVILTFVLFFFSTILLAQNKWSAEFRPNLNFTTQNLNETNLKTGFGFEITIAYKLKNKLFSYAGLGYNIFEAKDTNIVYNSKNFTFGLQFISPINKDSKLSYLVKIGGIYNFLQIKDSKNNTIYNTDYKLGFELGIGINYYIIENWSLRPQISFRTVTIDLPETNDKLNYLGFSLGISKTF